MMTEQEILLEFHHFIDGIVGWAAEDTRVTEEEFAPEIAALTEACGNMSWEDVRRVLQTKMK